MDRRRFMTLLGALPAAAFLGRSSAKAFEAGDAIVRIENGRLILGGRRFRFFGVNIYSLLSRPAGDGFTCGNAFTDSDVATVFDEVVLMGANAVRIVAYQSHLTDPKTGARDYSRLDLAVREAEKRGLKLIVAFENQWMHCTSGGYKFAKWYAEGYKAPYGLYPLSYRAHVAETVARYVGRPGILIWQLMNEAESKTSRGETDPEVLMAFSADMIALVKERDPTHLVDLGTIGLDSPGSGGPFYALLHTPLSGRAVPDLCEVHDYDPGRGVPKQVADAHVIARALGKPFYIGEVGVRPRPGWSLERRANAVLNKILSAWEEDVDGIVVWSYRAGDGSGFDFDREDPLFQKIRSFTWSYLRPG